ncbi:MAG: hypothetical protein ACW97Z_17735 [Candidatus Hodarchaeales archaeon]
MRLVGECENTEYVGGPPGVFLVEENSTIGGGFHSESSQNSFENSYIIGKVVENFLRENSLLIGLLEEAN